jgi:hypothetical protein
MKTDRITHQFVEYIPDRLEDGVLYVSIPFVTAVHKCCCGCGNQVVTPFSRTDWKLIFDGESVSLSPSIGNWSFPCQSHYWIEHDRVKWTAKWTPREIASGRTRDALRKSEQFTPATQPKRERNKLWQKLTKWWR